MRYLSDELVDKLEDLGATFPDRFGALIVIETFQDALADERAAEALHRVREYLRGDLAGMALDRVLFGATNSLRKDAGSVGATHQALAKRERSIRAKLPLPLQCVKIAA